VISFFSNQMVTI